MPSITATSNATSAVSPTTRNLSNYLRELYQYPDVSTTVNIDHIKHHYYGSHRHINPTGIVPLGPELKLNAPHNRGRLGV